MTTTAEQIAERLVIAVLSAYDNVEYPDSPAVKALLDAGLREAVVRMESAHENLMHLSGEAVQARRHIFLALAALKGDKA